jgi:hypothetical protein
MKLLTKRQRFQKKRIRGQIRPVWVARTQVGGNLSNYAYDSMAAIGKALFSKASKDFATKLATDTAKSMATGVASEAGKIGTNYVVDKLKPKQKEDDMKIIRKLLEQQRTKVVKKLPNKRKTKDHSRQVLESLINGQGLKHQKRQIGKGFKII